MPNTPREHQQRQIDLENATERNEEETQSLRSTRPPSYTTLFNPRDPDHIGALICFVLSCFICVFMFGYLFYAIISSIVSMAVAPTPIDWTKIIFNKTLNDTQDRSNKTVLFWGHFIHFFLDNALTNRTANESSF